MTLGIGIKCEDGVVVAFDSQVEFGRGVSVKRVNANKIYKITDRLAVAGAGTMSSIDKAIDTISSTIENQRSSAGRDLSLEEQEDSIEKAMTALHKDYNIERSKFLGREEENFFNAILVIGGVSETVEPYLSIAHPEGLVERMRDYGTVGAGSAFAELLLKNFYFPAIKVEEGIRIALHVIKEVEEVNPDVGGPINVGFLTSEGYGELESKEREKIFNELTPALRLLSTHIIPRIVKGEIDVDKLRNL